MLLGHFKHLIKFGKVIGMEFVAIDFETANERRSSVCSLGIAVVRDSSIVEQKYWLIRPKQLYFNRFNVGIHGITEKDVEDKPNFYELWPSIKSYLENKIVVAHYASFDISVLRGVLDEYGIPYPDLKYSCTWVISRRTWPALLSHSLDLVAEYLGIDFQHHHALEDALACAGIAVRACEETGVKSLIDLADKLKYLNGRLYPGGYEPLSYSIGYKPKPRMKIVPSGGEFDKDHPFYSRTIVFTGTLKSMTRRAAWQKVIELGGRCATAVNESVDYLVIGEQDYRKLKGKVKSSKMLKVERLNELGCDIVVINESEFVKMIYS